MSTAPLWLINTRLQHAYNNTEIISDIRRFPTVALFRRGLALHLRRGFCGIIVINNRSLPIEGLLSS